MSNFEKAWDVVRKFDPCDMCGDDNLEEYEDPNLKGVCAFCSEEMQERAMKEDEKSKDNCASCGFYRDPNSDYCRDCFDGATPKDRNNPNPHPLDGMLDDSFVSANEAYSLWDEGYEPNYDSVVEAAKSVLEAMGYEVIPPNDPTPDDDDWERENKDNLEPNKEMRRRE